MTVRMSPTLHWCYCTASLVADSDVRGHELHGHIALPGECCICCVRTGIVRMQCNACMRKAPWR
jgi:hypothetical protein